MDVLKDAVYILVEGAPSSPEVPIFDKILRDIARELGVAGEFHVVEVGGCDSFNVFANYIYARSSRHQRLPVIAVSDRDYRTAAAVSEDVEAAIKNRTAYRVYWKRHEWENYLLDETGWMAEAIGAIPVKSKSGKLTRLSSKVPSPEEIEALLDGYFDSVVATEFVTCLRFNLQQRARRPHVTPVDARSFADVDDYRRWFVAQATEPRAMMDERRAHDEFDAICADMCWTSLLTGGQVDRALAKTRFCGKEAIGELSKRLGQCYNIPRLTAAGLKELLLYGGRYPQAMRADLRDMIRPMTERMASS